MMYIVSQKEDTKHMAVTVLCLDRFSNSFTGRLSGKSTAKWLLKDLIAPYCVAMYAL